MSDKVQPETSAKCSLRDVLAEKDAEIERLRRDVANLTAAGRAVGRGHARQTARAEAAEAEVARLRGIDVRALAESIAKDTTSPSEWRSRGWRLQAALIDTIERRLDAALAPRPSAPEDEWLAVDPGCTCVHMDGKRHQSPSCTVQHAESASEAPRTRDGEQGGER